MLQKTSSTNGSKISYSDLINAKFDETQAVYTIKKISELEATNDILQLIKFQQLILCQVRQKADQKSNLELNIVKQLISNYDVAIRKNPQNYDLHLQYFNFCSCTQDVDGMNKIISILTQKFSNVPEMWFHIANWYETICKDYTQARHFIRKGLILHKNNHLLYSAGIKLEISKANLLVIKDQSVDKEEVDEVDKKEIKTYIEAILENVKDFDFYLDILKLLEPYPYTTEEQQKIVEEFLKNYVNEPRMWDVLAQRELRLYYQSDDKSKNSFKCHLDQCVKIFKDGLNQITSERRTLLWRLYLNFVVEYQNDISIDELLYALNNGYKENMLIESDYLTWIRYVLQEHELTNILQKSTDALPQSVELWKHRLKHAMHKKRSNLNAVFDEGVKTLKKDALPLWHMLIRYYTLTKDKHFTREFYKKAIKQYDEIANIIKPMYVRWLACTFTIFEAREAYNELANKEPFCRELHEQMIKLEEVQINIDYTRCEKAFDNYCSQFGCNDADVWCAYDLFCLKLGKLENSEKVVQRATSTLNPMLLSTFQERHKLLINEMNKDTTC